mgnify:CR=1 FL=1
MFFIVLLVFFGAACVIVWATYASIAGCVPLWSRVFYLVSIIASAISAYFSTFHYTYFANADTQFHGWPVPTVVFQREGPDAPWLDFVGPTIFLAYPMNVVLFTIVPPIIVLVVYRLQQRRALNTFK